MPPVVDRGAGPPIVVVPGIQGKWEYVRPAVEALARWFRVITFPLAGEAACDSPFDLRDGFANYTRQCEATLDRLGMQQAIICGISFGGLIALRLAAERPERTAGLVLVSTPGPSWRLRRRHEIYARRPRLCGPLLLAETPRRLADELKATFPVRSERQRFIRSQLREVLRTPLSFARMAERALMISSTDSAAAARHVTAPTLIVTGEPPLDHVVSVQGSSEYLHLIPGARGVVLNSTGHLGSITRPEAFATCVRDFAQGAAGALWWNGRLHPDDPEAA